jgi:hypothetical protein
VQIVIEKADGELVKVIDMEEGAFLIRPDAGSCPIAEQKRRSEAAEDDDDVVGDFPNLHRLDSTEHNTMSRLLASITHASGMASKENVHNTFSEIAGPPKAAAAKERSSPARDIIKVPAMAKRPTAIRFNTAGIKQRLFGKPGPDTAHGTSATQPRASVESVREEADEAAPAPAQDFSREFTRTTSIRFDLPSDPEVRRYDLQE